MNRTLPVALAMALVAAPSVVIARGHGSHSSGSHYSGSGGSSHRSYSASSHHSSYRASTSRSSSGSHTKRSKAARDAFMRTHPCPSTGKTHGACPGYVVDHKKALKRGGADSPENMQWQTVEEAKAKDKWE